jgi:hypothetical protein
VEFYWGLSKCDRHQPREGRRMWDNHEIEIIWDGSSLWSLR